MIVHRGRRAAEFEALVQGTRTPTDDATAELLELVGALREARQPGRRPEPRPEFVVDLRERLMVSAREELVADDPIVQQLTVRPRRTSRDRRVSVALAGFALVGASTSVAVAAQDALPGETLYPVKRALENAETGIATSDTARGAELLENARTRLDEVDALAATGDPDVTVVEETLGDFAAQATEASDLLLAAYQASGDTAQAQQLGDFSAEGVERLGALDRRLPEEAHDAVVEAAHVLFTIDAAVRRLCPDCGGGITEIPTQLLASTGPAKDATTDGRTTPASTADDSEDAEPPQQELPQSPVSVPGIEPAAPAAEAPSTGTGAGLPGGSADAPTTAPAEVGKVTKPVTGPVEAVEDTVKSVEDSVVGTVKDTTEGVEETAEDVVDSVEGVVGGLTGTGE